MGRQTRHTSLPIASSSETSSLSCGATAKGSSQQAMQFVLPPWHLQAHFEKVEREMKCFFVSFIILAFGRLKDATESETCSPHDRTNNVAKHLFPVEGIPTTFSTHLKGVGERSKTRRMSHSPS